MNVSSVEMVNVALIIFLLFLMTRHSDTKTVLLVLFLYGTLHFSFSIATLYLDNYTDQWAKLHTNGGGVLTEVSAFLLLCCSFVLLSRYAHEQFLLSPRKVKKIIAFLGLVMVAVFCGYLFNIRFGDWRQLKNVISIESLLLLLLIGPLALGNNKQSLSAVKFYSWSLLGLILFAIVDCIAIYEVFSHRSWAGTFQSSGIMVYRASSVLFNPNLFGFWASIVYLGCAYGMYQYKEHRKVMICGMVLASTAIYFSGSRSAGYTLLVMMFISTALIKERLRWVPLMVLPVSVLSVYGITSQLIIPFVTSKEGWYAIVYLGDRLFATPAQIFGYIGMVAGYSELGAPIEIAQSIEGRFKGEDLDSGWISLYNDIGWFGMVSIILMSIAGLWWGVKIFLAERSTASVFALTTLCYCLLIGVAMRYQVFPIWLFVGVALTPCLAFWMRVSISDT